MSMTGARGGTDVDRRVGNARQNFRETKPSFMTTEF
jgi:uncharacterized MAPEG superfamily protein